ncbi:TspO/MBR family protein [Clostridium sp. Marseille-QA1073]
MLYIIQLALNLAWPIIFFYFQLRFLALIDIVLLLIFILLTVIAFYRRDKIAGLIPLPYLLWSTFTLLLNYKVYKLNK